MRSILFTLVLALLIPFSAAAGDQPARIRVSNLEKTPIVVTPLKIWSWSVLENVTDRGL